MHKRPCNNFKSPLVKKNKETNKALLGDNLKQMAALRIILPLMLFRALTWAGEPCTNGVS